MALEGPLKELHIQDVFQLLDLGRKSGVLRVTSELRQTAGTVCFERGGVVAAARRQRSPAARRPAGAGRQDHGEPISTARARMQNGGDGRRLGDILVDLGAITRRELDRQLKAQIEEAVFELLGWSEGYFRFEEGAPCHAAVEAPVRFPTEALLMEAARRIDEWSRIESKVPHLRLVPRLPPPEQQGSEQAGPGAVRVGGARRGGRRSATSTRWPRCWAARSSRWRARSTGSPMPASSCWTIRRTPVEEAEPGRDLAALLVPAREALAQGAVRHGRRRAGGAAAEPIRSCPRRAGCSACAQAALGRFRRGARDCGPRGAGSGPRTPGEEAEAPAVERLRQAVETIVKELESYRD